MFIAVFGLLVENRVGDGVSSLLLEDGCLRMDVDPWGFALCLSLAGGGGTGLGSPPQGV